MYKICPKCGSIAEYNAYYGRTMCTNCSWEDDKIEKKIYYIKEHNNSSKHSHKLGAKKLVKA